MCHKEGVNDKMPLAGDLDITVIVNFVGKRFPFGARWELEGANKDDVYVKRGPHNIGGEKFREPTV